MTSLKEKATLLMTGLTVILLLISSALNYFSSVEQAQINSKDKLTAVTALTAQSLVDTLKNAAKTVQYASSLKKYNAIVDNSEDLSLLLSDIVMQHTGFDSLFVVDNQKNIIATSRKSFKTPDFNILDEYNTAKSRLPGNSVFISQLRFEPMLDSEVIALVNPLIGSDPSSPSHFVIGFLNWSELYQVVNNNELNRQGLSIAIINQNILDKEGSIKLSDSSEVILGSENILVKDNNLNNVDINAPIDSGKNSVGAKQLQIFQQFPIALLKQTINDAPEKEQFLYTYKVINQFQSSSDWSWTILAFDSSNHQNFFISSYSVIYLGVSIFFLFLITFSVNKFMFNSDFSVATVETAPTHSIGSLPYAEDFIDTTINTMYSALFSVNAQGRINFINRRSIQLLGIEEASLIGVSIDKIISIQSTLKSTQSILKEKIRLYNQVGQLKTDRTCIPVLLNTSPLKSGGMIYLAHDIRFTQQLIDEINQARIISESMVKAIPLALVTVEEDLSITYTNPHFNFLFGPNRITENITGLIDCPELAQTVKDLQKTAKASSKLSAKDTKQNQQERLFSLTVVPVRHINTLPNQNWALSHLLIKEQKNSHQTVIIIEDITEKMSIAKANEKLEYQLRHTQKVEAIGMLAGGIAHKMNNILAPILGFTDIVINNLKDDDSNKYLLEHVIENTLKAKETVQKILKLGQLDNDFSVLNLEQELMHIAQTLATSTPRNIKITTNIQEKYCFIRGNLEQLEQAFTYLCTNAIHAIGDKPDGRVCLSLTKSEKIVQKGEPSQEVYHLKIEDNGVGMDENTIKRIFEPFFSTKNSEYSTGLGLSVTDQIIINHGGQIEVGSQLGTGSVFNIYLPCLKASDTRLNEIQSLKDKSNKPLIDEISIDKLKGNECILLVDDETMIVEMAKNMLDRLGYKVTQTTNSQEALNKFSQSPDQFDLVITDYIMPNMNGAELAKQLLDIRPDLPIILLTGYSADFTEKTCNDLGIKARLTKPVGTKELGFTVRQALTKQVEPELD